MSKIQINELNALSLNEVSDREIKQVVGGYYWYGGSYKKITNQSNFGIAVAIGGGKGSYTSASVYQSNWA
jgi:natural product precursor